jgi:leader peptidase (prepilin peptidase) / N-methyltransferase
MVPIEFYYPFVFIFGLIFGSFANVLIYRMPKRMSIALPGSFCPHCKEPIAPYDNIPVLSYLFLRGKCRKCGGKIAVRYPLVELVSGILFLAVFWKYGLTLKCAWFVIFAFIMMAHGFIDYENYLLLDKLNIVLAIVGIAGLSFIPGLEFREGIFGAIAGGGLLGLVYGLTRILFRKEGMGIGDIKTALACGLFLGVEKTVFMILLASGIGIIWGVGKMAAGKGRMLPFGTMMAIASVILVLWGRNILGWFYSM